MGKGMICTKLTIDIIICYVYNKIVMQSLKSFKGSLNIPSNVIILIGIV